jgi:hypothetical protein
VTVTVSSGATTATTNVTGTVVITAPVSLTASVAGGQIQLSWPLTPADALVEESEKLGAEAHWVVSTNVVATSGGQFIIATPNAANRFFRLRKL